MKSSINFIWEAVNNSYSVVLGAESLNMVTILVVLHIFLAILTLCLGNQTVCDIFRPLRKIFQPDAESLLEGVGEIVVAVPNAIIYYGKLYISAYILALRVAIVVFLSLLGGAVVLLVVLAILSATMGEEYLNQPSDFAEWLYYAHYFVVAYCFWCIDGKRLAHNFINAWRC